MYNNIYGINNYDYHASESDIEFSLNKLLYEIFYRKKEFLNLCSKHDQYYTGRIDKNIFKSVLTSFSPYLEEFDRNNIVNKYTIEDKYIDYINLTEKNSTYIPIYMDEFLSHLNKTNNDDNNNNKNFNTAPIANLNNQLNEENFMTKIAKDVMSYLIINSDNNINFPQELMKKNDFDNDGKYTIGELNNFLKNCKVELADSDLRYFFEFFPLIEGRIDCENLMNYFKTNSQKKYEQTAKINFDENELSDRKLKKELENEKQYFNDLMNTNYIIKILQECLLIFGKTFLLKYFSKFLDFENNEFYIDNTQLETGLNFLGYRKPNSIDSGNFKQICITKKIGNLKNEENNTTYTTNININLEKLFDLINDYFSMNSKVKKYVPDEIVNRMGVGYINKLNDSILSMVSSKIKGTDFYDNKINEFEFRRKFIKNFGFIDHAFLDMEIKGLCCVNDKLIDNLNNNIIINNINNNNNNIDNDEDEDGVKKSGFYLKYLYSKNYLELSYNILFMNMIKNYESIGLLLDEEDIKNLNGIYTKLLNKIFNEYDDNIDNYYNMNNIIPKKNIQPKIKEDKDEDLKSFSKSNNDEISNNNNNDYILGNLNVGNGIKINDVSSRQYFINKKQINDEFKLKSKINNNVNNQIEKKINPINAIPKLYNICERYLKNCFQLENMTYDILVNIGICKLFRDDLIKKGVDIKKKMHWIFLIRNIDDIVAGDVKDFMEKLAKDFKDSDGNLNILYYFSKVEEILLQYFLMKDKENKLKESQKQKGLFLY